MNEAERRPRNRVRAVSVVVGLLLLMTLPLVPWLSRGLKQSGVQSEVLDVGGRVTFGMRLVDSGDYFVDRTDRDKKWLRDLVGRAYTDDLTVVELKNRPDWRSKHSNLIYRLGKLPELEALEVSGSPLTDDDLRNLLPARSLKKLWLNGCAGITNDGLMQLPQLPNLLSLGLDDTVVDDDAMAQIAQLTNLRRLYLANTQVGDRGVAKLTSLRQLLGIGLEGTQVTDTGVVEHLVQLTTLEEVRLSATRITNEGAAYLARLPNLKNLNLARTDLSSDGLAWLKECSQLEFLDLEGAHLDARIIDSIAEIPKLVHVRLQGTGLAVEAIGELKRRVGNGVTVQSDAGVAARAN